MTYSTASVSLADNAACGITSSLFLGQLRCALEWFKRMFQCSVLAAHFGMNSWKDLLLYIPILVCPPTRSVVIRAFSGYFLMYLMYTFSFDVWRR